MRIMSDQAAWALRRIAALAAVLVFSMGPAGCGKELSGRYDEIDGTGSLEFKGRRVYMTTMLNTVLVADYEIDGQRVIIRGSGGSQVYTRDGDTIDAGMGIRYVKK
jgi:hypothetical protein